MILRLLILFTVVPILELYLLLQLSSVTNIWFTLAVVMGTGLAGAILAKRQGVMAIRNFQQALAQGRLPALEIVEGVIITFAAALMLTPGLLTDSLGLMLLVPTTRGLIRRWFTRRYAGRFHVTRFGGNGQRSWTHPDTIEADFSRRET